MSDDVKPTKIPTALRLVIGIVMACLLMAAVGIVAFPYLIDTDRPGTEPITATDSRAMAIADELEFSMTDQQITAAAAGRGATVVELRRAPDSTTALVDIPASVVLEPTTHACYEFVLMPDKDVAFEKVDECPIALPSN